MRIETKHDLGTRVWVMSGGKVAMGSIAVIRVTDDGVSYIVGAGCCSSTLTRESAIYATREELLAALASEAPKELDEA
ncbi:MAG: hypothetical protein NC342_08810 [Pseudoflavonifractor sp.]|nr:hypothetical protein [Alloprevotella sp.]MCM1117621.1 hypothetical protein [Pseudoflavonifractor sp.]